jgi:nucleotide-binding universal stress UspA family protein
MITTAPPPSASALLAKSVVAAKDDRPSGLTRDEARRRLEKFGPNAMPDATLHPLRMALEKFWTPVPWMIEDTAAQYKVRMQEHAEKTLGAVAQAAQAAGVACEMVHVEHEHPYQAIIDTAESKGCDLIVMASHGRHGISAIVLGSETVKVLTHSKIPVLVHR